MADATMEATHSGHEPDRPSLRTLAIGAAVVIVMIVIAIGASLGIITTGSEVRVTPAAPTGTPTPRLQPAPEADIAAYRREKEALLHGYAWVDRAHGIVRIPIEQAMARLASPQPQQAKPP
jgi:hypothetical protein